MNAGRLLLQKARLSDFATRLRYIAERWRLDDDLSSLFTAGELGEIADVLEEVSQSPKQGSADWRTRGTKTEDGYNG